MGWKLSSIIINPATEVNAVDLLRRLGARELTKVEDEPFDSVMYPEKDTVYIGNYKGNFIICADLLPLDFFNSSLSNTEKLLIEYFPESEICAVSLQSTVNQFGFAVITNGRKIRVKASDAQTETSVDIGEPLEEEQQLLSMSEIDGSGQRVYHLDNNRNKPYLENQVGENFIFEIFKRYTGKLLDEDDDLLDTVFVGYKFTTNTGSIDDYFSGQWQGEYSYGDGYKDSIKDTTEVFTLNLQLSNIDLTGTCVDGDKLGDQPATIRGFLIHSFIGFTKEYPIRYVLDEKGIAQTKRTGKPTTVIYSGLYDPLTDSFKGIWRVDNKNFWGAWTMKRKKI